ncbi:hypothetical protein F4808DRAFT_169835 [Astrocystis sublimbata]|nr:hypothetical protein F4808DRAFT_169835 [Astrocystis sublimbata]
MAPPIDPRGLLPSRADPEHRKHRKELEKGHGVCLTEVAVLGLIGLTMAWDMEKQVRKKEERKDKAELEQKEREKRDQRRRGRSTHDGRSDSRRGYVPSDGGSRRSGRGGRDGRDDTNASQSYARDPRRRQSVDPRADPRYFDDRYRDYGRDQERAPRHESRDHRRYESPYDEDMRKADMAERGRSRRDSW